MSKIPYLVAPLVLAALFSTASIASAQTCVGDNYGTSGTCRAAGACSPAQSDSSSSCTGSTPVCCSATVIDTGPGPGTNPNPNTNTNTNTSAGINVSAIKKIGDGIINVINSVLVPILIAVAFFTFLIGVYKYFILGAADDKSRQTGRMYVLWGIIGLVVVFAVWGLVNFVAGVFDLNIQGGKAPKPPTF
jgi:hypothetical protein